MKFIKLHKPREFDKRFEENYTDSGNQREAYEKTELEYKSVFGETKYSSFESFINTYYNRVRELIKN